jgi:DNA-directed RNA polymerase specialized sigma24 family protein
MRPEVKRYRPFAFLLNSVDRLGRTIDPTVLSVASEIAPRALLYAEKLLGDPALAMNLFEEAAATVSHALKEKSASGSPSVHDMRGYLFRAFLRRIGRERRTEILIEPSTDASATASETLRESDDPDLRVLTKELLRRCDRVTQEIILHRLEGFSWREIERDLGIPIPLATQRYSRAIQHLRDILRGRGRVA